MNNIIMNISSLFDKVIFIDSDIISSQISNVIGRSNIINYKAVKQPNNFYVLVRTPVPSGFVPEKQANNFYTFTATTPSTYKLDRDPNGFVVGAA